MFYTLCSLGLPWALPHKLSWCSRPCTWANCAPNSAPLKRKRKRGTKQLQTSLHCKQILRLGCISDFLVADVFLKLSAERLLRTTSSKEARHLWCGQVNHIYDASERHFFKCQSLGSRGYSTAVFSRAVPLSSVQPRTNSVQPLGCLSCT